MQILRNDILTIPLYHSTSSLFKNSIISHGLGAVNPLDALQVLPFLKYTYELYNQLFFGKEELLCPLTKLVIEKILNQEITDARFNFRHGSTYLTPNLEIAVRYASHNSFGSEALSKSITLYKMLIKQNPANVQDVYFKEHPIIQLVNREIYPVLFELQDLDINILRSESGGSAREQVLRMERFEESYFN